MKIKKTFRLEENTVVQLGKLAEIKGISQTEALEGAIQYAIREPYVLPYASHTPTGGFEEKISDATNALIKQLDVKDKQIAELTAALASAQRSVEQAHALNAADKAGMALESTPQKKTRLQRLRDAWNG